MKRQSLRKPHALVTGDKIRLVAPASPFAREKLIAGMEVIAALGFAPVVDRREFVRSGFLAGDDRSRAEKLTAALAERETRAVWCIRGGYGITRLLPLLDLATLKSHPKLLIGFSDVTAILNSLSASDGFVTIHGPVVTQLPDLPLSARRWLRNLISNPVLKGHVPIGRLQTVVPGTAEGRLLGGNLSLLSSLCGTPYMPDFSGSILLIEDTGEEAYRLDRMFVQLLQSGALRNVRGVVLGSLNKCRPTGRGRYSARAVLARAAAALGVPLVAGGRFGHADRHIALPLGVRVRLDASAGTLTLLEPAVQ
jgi:muramoyltetrapeptide carboxypeptidase